MLIVAASIAAAPPVTAKDRPIESYPESQRYLDCVVAKAESYASQPGSPLDLAIVAYAACESDRIAFARALRREYGRKFVDTFMQGIKSGVIGSAAEIIVEQRRATSTR